MKPYLIGIAGPSCAGKSYLSTHLARHLKAAKLNLDSYYSDLQHLSLAAARALQFRRSRVARFTLADRTRAPA